MKDENLIVSVARACKVFKVLGKHPKGISLKKLSETTQLPKPTTYRILQTFSHSGLVVQHDESKKYKLGKDFLEMSLEFLNNFDLRRESIPYMEDLQKKIGETINLAMLDGKDVIYIARVESKEPLRHSMSIGSKAPAYSTALGKSILAFKDKEHVRKLLSQEPLVKRTNYTETDIEKIMKSLERIRQTKIAIDDREHQEHIRCIGSPIFYSDNEVVGAISISGPAVRITPDFIEMHKQEVRSTAEEISRKLGWVN